MKTPLKKAALDAAIQREWDRVQGEVRAFNSTFVRIWQAMQDMLTARMTPEVIERAVRTRDPQVILGLVPGMFSTTPIIQKQDDPIDPSFFGIIKRVLFEIVGKVFTRKTTDYNLLTSFTLENPAVRTALEREAGRMLVEVSETTFEAVKAALLLANEESKYPRKIARLIEDSIGLTKTQVSFVDNFRARLWMDAETLIPGAEGMAYDQLKDVIEKRVQAYRQRKIRERALTIARTETVKALDLGQRMAWEEAESKGVFPQGLKRVWIASPTSLRTCKICRQLHGQEAGLRTPFESEYVGEVMGPPSHPQCRCSSGTQSRPIVKPLTEGMRKKLDQQEAEFRTKAASVRQERLRSLRFLQSQPTPRRELRNIPGFEGARART